MLHPAKYKNRFIWWKRLSLRNCFMARLRYFCQRLLRKGGRNERLYAAGVSYLLSCPLHHDRRSQVLDAPETRGWVFELAVGAQMLQMPGELFYWREKNDAVDFVYRYQGRLYAIEVKSGRRKSAKGLETFLKKFPDASPIILTADNFSLFSEDPDTFLSNL